MIIELTTCVHEDEPRILVLAIRQEDDGEDVGRGKYSIIRHVTARLVQYRSGRWSTCQSKMRRIKLCYRPQTKFGARLCFYTCLWFCSQGGVPGQVTPPPGRYTRYTPYTGTPPWGRYTSPAGTPPKAGTPQTGTPPRQVHPRQCMRGYGQQAGNRHPTGMHSC